MQGVVTYLASLHRAVEVAVAANRAGVLFEFWYGVDTTRPIDPSLLPPGARLMPIRSGNILWRLFVLPFVLRRKGFSVAHFQYVCPVFKLGMRYVTTIHDVLFLEHKDLFSLGYRLPRRILFGWSARHSDLVLTVSEQSARAIASILHPPLEPIVVPNGAPSPTRSSEVELRQVAGLIAREFILTVGRVEPRKNYARLAEAFAASGLPQRGTTLVIVGFCSPEFHTELAHLRATPSITWLPAVTGSELAWLYSNARAFIYPSLCEGFGIPVLEAMHARLPCALSKTFPLSDVLAAAPLSFEPKDVRAIRRALEQLWFGDYVVQDYSATLARYSWERAADSYLKALARFA
jgi:glycosyltransferase involved in cell wall biosynthesis